MDRHPLRDEVLVAEIWEALDTVVDPCHVLSGHDLSILDLGLVNRVEVDGRSASVAITLTEIGCTFGYRIMEQIEEIAGDFAEIDAIKVVIEPFPTWTPDRLSQRARDHHAFARRAFQFSETRSPGQVSAE